MLCSAARSALADGVFPSTREVDSFFLQLVLLVVAGMVMIIVPIALARAVLRRRRKAAAAAATAPVVPAARVVAIGTNDARVTAIPTARRRMPTRTTDTLSSTPPAAARTGDRLIGVFSTLAEQHRQVAAMLAQLQQDPASRALQWPAVRRELVSHEHGEVRELYPVLRQYEELRAFADRHDEEARELEALIGRLDTLDVQSAAWGDVLDVLVSTVLHHAKDEEEREIFPAAQNAIGEARAIELDAKVLLAKQLVGEQQ